MAIPKFPQVVPVLLEHKDELIPFFSTIKDGMCENTFASLFLDSYKYNYSISKLEENSYLVLGKNVQSVELSSELSSTSLQFDFFCILGSFPCKEKMQELLNHSIIKSCHYLKNVSEQTIQDNKETFEFLGLNLELDRNNCDYLYKKTDLAELKGKAFHKKKNLVNQFNNSYSVEVKEITDQNVSDAVYILNKWKENRTLRGESDEGDFLQCSLSLQYRNELKLTGIIVYANGEPAGFSLGECVCNGKMYVCHFEKALDSVHGIYQGLNQLIAKSLPQEVSIINREQDLGNEGLRQAKMTYRPCDMVNKYKVQL